MAHAIMYIKENAMARDEGLLPQIVKQLQGFFMHITIILLCILITLDECTVVTAHPGMGILIIHV